MDMRGISVSRNGYKTPCTSCEGRPCNIFEDLRLWNRFFWPVGFELRELSPGQLSLVELREASVPSERAMREVKDAVTVLRRLLTNHRCVVSVDLNDELLKHHHQTIRGALRGCVTLTKLKLCMPSYATKASLRLVSKLAQFKNLRELVLRRVPFNSKSVEGFSAFLASTRSLTTLDITEQDFGLEDAVIIIQGLQQNATITTLLLDTNLLTEASPEAGKMFSRYLSTNKRLSTLSVTSLSHSPSPNLRAITDPLHHNATLSVLNLIGLDINLQNHKLISDMLRKNSSLTILRMPDCYCDDKDRHRNSDERAPVDDASPVPMWLAALRENKVLKELTLDLSWINRDDCDSLFKALARHVSLKKVTVQTIPDDCVAQACRAIRGTGVPERFFLGMRQVSKGKVVELEECRELSRVSMDHSRSPQESELLRDTLERLPSDVKSLCLTMREASFHGIVSSLAEYISNTKALRELDLRFFPKSWTSEERPLRALLQALSKNKGIRQLTLHGIDFDETEADMLVKLLHSSRTLCQLSVSPRDGESVPLLFQRLSIDVSSNFTLLGIDVGTFEVRCIGDKFAIDDVVRRNNSLTVRAADFVKGKRDKYCAAAAELVRLHPGLVMKIQELESVSEGEAVSQIKSALKSIMDLDDFMSLAGVVKDTVSCHTPDDESEQPTDSASEHSTLA